jgi:hypothetical protein
MANSKVLTVNNNAKAFTVFLNPATPITSSLINSIEISRLVAGSYTIIVNDGETQRSEKFIKH